MATVARTPAGVAFADYAAQIVSSPYGAPIEPDSKPSKSLESLNNQLMTHGWAKKPIQLDALKPRDLSHVVGVMFELLGSSVTNLATLDDLNARYRTLSYENERAHKQMSAQQAARTRTEAEMVAWKARCEDAEVQLKAEKEHVKELREEINRGKRMMESVKLAAVHDAKKSQMQLDKAQQQLARIGNEPAGSSKPQGLILLNPITGNRTHPIAPPQSTLVEQSVKDLAEIRQRLQEEADAFRHVVVSTGNALRDVVAMAEGREDPPRFLYSQFFAALDQPKTRSIAQSSSSSTSHASIADARLKDLIRDVRGIIASGIDVALHTQEPRLIDTQAEEERLQAMRDQARVQSELENRLKDLEVEIACVRAKEEEAQRVVAELSKAQASREAAPNNGVEEAIQSDLRQQREQLVEERRKFTEAAMRLGQERRHFESERNAFLDERRQADLDALQNFLPSSPSDNGLSSPSSKISTSRVTDPLPNTMIPSSPWTAHRPVQPSPLSVGHKPRTPKVHRAGNKKVKTPLSRLVMERGLKTKMQSTTDKSSEVGPLKTVGIPLGPELGKQTNRQTSSGVSTLGKAVQSHEVVKKIKEPSTVRPRAETSENVQPGRVVSGRRVASGGSTKPSEAHLKASGAGTAAARKGAWR